MLASAHQLAQCNTRQLSWVDKLQLIRRHHQMTPGWVEGTLNTEALAVAMAILEPTLDAKHYRDRHGEAILAVHKNWPLAAQTLAKWENHKQPAVAKAVNHKLFTPLKNLGKEALARAVALMEAAPTPKDWQSTVQKLARAQWVHWQVMHASRTHPLRRVPHTEQIVLGYAEVSVHSMRTPGGRKAIYNFDASRNEDDRKVLDSAPLWTKDKLSHVRRFLMAPPPEVRTENGGLVVAVGVKQCHIAVVNAAADALGVLAGALHPVMLVCNTWTRRPSPEEVELMESALRRGMVSMLTQPIHQNSAAWWKPIADGRGALKPLVTYTPVIIGDGKGTLGHGDASCVLLTACAPNNAKLLRGPIPDRIRVVDLDNHSDAKCIGVLSAVLLAAAMEQPTLQIVTPPSVPAVAATIPSCIETNSGLQVVVLDRAEEFQHSLSGAAAGEHPDFTKAAKTIIEDQGVQHRVRTRSHQTYSVVSRTVTHYLLLSSPGHCVVIVPPPPPREAEGADDEAAEGSDRAEP